MSLPAQAPCSVVRLRDAEVLGPCSEQAAHGEPTALWPAYWLHYAAEWFVSVLADTYGALLLVVLTKWFYEQGSKESDRLQTLLDKLGTFDQGFTGWSDDDIRSIAAPTLITASHATPEA